MDADPVLPGRGSPLELVEKALVGPQNGLLYRVEPSRIPIVAVAHLHRRPGYWRTRL
jgi:hypothetical protein